jgi:Bacterial Ig-like domain (group 3)
MTRIQTLRTFFLAFRPVRVMMALGLLLMFGFAQSVLAQTGTNPLNFGNNYFVTGDYVVAGVGLRGLGVNGLATQQFKMPDANSVPSTGVPPGADIVAALLFWETVESSGTFAGQNGFFRPMVPNGPATPGYPIIGAILGNPNAPVSWSAGGCSGNSQGSKTMVVYSADVRALLPVDSNGSVLAGNILAPMTYEVSLADSGSNGGGVPLTLGASLVIIYRALDSGLPLNSVVIYDGSFAPSNSSDGMSQTLYGFYQAAASPISKLTHIVGNGQNNKFETVSLNNVNLPSLYGKLPSFPGFYNGSWDNPTWSFPNLNLNPSNPVNAGSFSATTAVGPTSQNGSCVSWGAVIVSTTVQSSGDGIVSDGLIDLWKTHNPPGYCDASLSPLNDCSTSDPSWVALPGATPGKRDLFVELDYMCSIVNTDGTCDTTKGYSFNPPQGALTMMANAFSPTAPSITPHSINVHFIPGNPGYPAQYATGAIQEQACTDTANSLCVFPNQPGIVGWKAGFESLKEQPLNYPDEASCEAALNGPCIRRFQHGRKDSYHYALFAHALGLPEWTLLGGSLASVVASGNTVTFTTLAPHGLNTVAGTDRVTIADAITNPSLNGTYSVQTPSPTTFTIQISTATNATYTLATDPELSVTSGQIETRSGFSDIGGADSLITLGLWGAAGQTDQVQGGTFMHELGHSNGLTHGGLYYDTPNTYFATFEPNCKPNYQSVMSYLFQVDLLQSDAQGDTVLDYSEQGLNPLNENSLPLGVTTTDGSALAYSTTKWYTPTQPGGVGTAATSHCDGGPLSNTDPNPTMYLASGPANPTTPEWVTPSSDINFDGTFSASLRGYNDWASLDLRQIGATGSDVLGGGGKGIVGGGGKGLVGGGGKAIVGGGGKGLVGGGGKAIAGGGGTGNGEITLAAANSYVRPPRNLTSALTASPHHIQLNWLASTFSQIGLYNIYRSTDGGTAVKINSVAGTSLTFTDTTVTCGPIYSYFVTAVLANSNPVQESVPSNTTSAIPICNPTSTTVASSANPSIFGQLVTFTATVTNLGTNTATPTGSVQFYVDGGTFGTPVPISGSGAAAKGTIATAILTVSGSPHTIKAVYTDTIDGNFSGSSGTLSQGQTVNPAPTSTIVNSSANPSIYGQSVKFTATVANAAGTGISTATPTGSVQFYVDGAAFGAVVPLSGSGASVTVTSGATATLNVSGSPHTVKAVYTNTDGNFNGSSGTLGQTVNPAPTSTTVTSSLNPSILGQSVTFTATVANTAGAAISTAIPTGSVHFMDGASLLGTSQNLSGLGTATLTTSTLGAGNHAITAVYTNIDGNFRGSTSTSLTQVVQDFSITATPSAQTISSGHQATYSVILTPINGLTGTIALSCSGAPSNSTCSVSPSTDNLQGNAVTSTVTLFANKNVNHGSFTLTFTGVLEGGYNLTHSTTVQITVK